MYNNSNICIIIPIIPRQKNKMKFNDVMMMSSSSPCDEQTWFGLNSPGSSWRRKKKFDQKLCISDEKQSIFHP